MHCLLSFSRAAQLLVEGQVPTNSEELARACLVGMSPSLLKREGQRLAARCVMEAEVTRWMVSGGGGRAGG